MAEKTDKPAEEKKEGGGGGGNGMVVVAILFMGLLNLGGLGGLGYMFMTKMNQPAPAAAGGAAGGHAQGGEGEAAAGGDEHGGGGDEHGGGDDEEHGDKGGEHHGPPGIVQQLPNIVVRLKDVEREHHARISLSLEFKATAEKAAIEASMPRVREATIRYASDRRYDEMRGSRGLLDMKKYLNKEARGVFGAEFVELYVTEFVAQ